MLVFTLVHAKPSVSGVRVAGRMGTSIGTMLQPKKGQEYDARLSHGRTLVCHYWPMGLR